MQAEITGLEALQKMRALKSVPKSSFGLIFITRQGKDGSSVRKYEHCRLRSSMRNEGLSVNADHYLYFTDCETDQPKQCWKRYLIREVKFDNVWYKVKWFE
jgi:hypothetical protein